MLLFFTIYFSISTLLSHEAKGEKTHSDVCINGGEQGHHDVISMD